MKLPGKFNEMLIDISGIKFSVQRYDDKVSPDGIPIFFLHGFTGSGNDWKGIIPFINQKFQTFTIDLIGHGRTGSPLETSFYETKSIVYQLKAITKKITHKKIILAGYSMGGRAALSFAVEFSGSLEGLILESSSAGIDDTELRKERVESDNELADFIQSHSMEEFVDFWMNIDLFESQKSLPNEKLRELRETKLKNNREGLTNTLRGFSTGKMPSLSEKLSSFKVKTLLITGELDKKFTRINSELLSKFQIADHQVIKNAGHNSHLEKPAEFINVINSFLNEF